MPPPYPSHAGVLHRYTSRLVAFEHSPPRVLSSPRPFPTYAAAATAAKQNPSPTTAPATNFILFVSGLGDTLCTVTYPALLATLLPASWAVSEVLLSSAGTGWTTSSLAKDAGELARAVKYFRELSASRLGYDAASVGDVETKILLMGHSTGCQVSMEYLVGPWKSNSVPESTLNRPKVDGVILQAGISDREGVAADDRSNLETVATSLATAKEMVSAGRGEDILPLSATGGVSMFGAQSAARRWVSLIDEEGDDDYFTSSLGPARVERVWGEGGVRGRGVPVLVLLGGEDEHMPKGLDKTMLLGKWRERVGDALWDGHSAVVPGASHNLNRSRNEPRQDLCDRVLGFVSRIAGEPIARTREDGEKL